MQKQTGRPTKAYIDLDALEHNMRLARDKVLGRKVLAVVKADGYGHGAVECARRLVKAGAEMLGVAMVEEAVELRRAGIKAHILLLGGIFDYQADEVVEPGLTPVVFTMSQAQALSASAVVREMELPVHFKIDTGMGRLGLQPEEAAGFIREVASLPGIVPEGIMTHLADVSMMDMSFTERQVDIFKKLVRKLFDDGIDFPLVHCAGSAAVLSYEPALFNMVRPGIMLYGCDPAGGSGPAIGLKPVMSLKTRILHLKRVSENLPISYGRTYYTNRPSLIATLPIGYADGVKRGLSNKGHALIGGKRCPIVGTVCMDMIMVDVTEVDDVRVGDEAVLIGSQGDETITAEEIAGHLDTISYEVLCDIGKRVPRVYL